MPYYAEENGPKDNLTLWRFMKFEKFCSILQSGGLFYASLATFEDPFEAILQPKSYSAKNLAHLKIKIKPRALKDMRLDQNYDRKHIGANCWNCSDVEPEFFWKLYSDLNFGIAIKSSVKRIKKAHAEVTKNIYIRNVIYDDLKIEDNEDFYSFHKTGALQMAHIKRPHFSQEKEVRCIVKLDALKRGTLVTGEMVKVNLFDLIEEVIYSPNSPKWFHDVVENTKSKYGYGQIKSSKSSLEY